MRPGATYAVITFLVGVILLLGWLYATAGNPRCGIILKKSLVLFALPMIFTPGGWLLANVGMWAVVAFEEGLKAFASTREHNRVDRFWLVSLFGIWELTLDKPFWGLVLAQPMANWDRVEVIGLVYATALPVLMHTVTASIYAFAFDKRIWPAFIASWAVHWTFNEAVAYFDLSVSAAIFETVILGCLLAGILTAKRPMEETVG
jgi:hypothetical protein